MGPNFNEPFYIKAKCIGLELFFLVGFDVCPPCAQDVHKKCVARFLRKIASDANICNDVQEFIDCYKDAGEPKEPCATVKIVKSFSRLCSKLGEKMLEKDQKHRGLMC